MRHDVPLAEPAGQVTSPQRSCVPPADRRNAWETGNLGWDVFYLGVFAAVLVIVLISTPGSKAVAAAAIGALVPWYLLVGRPLWTGRPGEPCCRAAVLTDQAIISIRSPRSSSSPPNCWWACAA